MPSKTSGKINSGVEFQQMCIYVQREIFEGEKFRVSVQNENSVEKTFAYCSGTSNYYVGVATKFCGENFRRWF